jgi:hypothetical protein
MPLSSASEEGLNGKIGFHNLETAAGRARKCRFSRGDRLLLRVGNKVATYLHFGEGMEGFGRVRRGRFWFALRRGEKEEERVHAETQRSREALFPA